MKHSLRQIYLALLLCVVLVLGAPVHAAEEGTSESPAADATSASEEAESAADEEEGLLLNIMESAYFGELDTTVVNRSQSAGLQIFLKEIDLIRRERMANIPLTTYDILASSNPEVTPALQRRIVDAAMNSGAALTQAGP